MSHKKENDLVRAVKGGIEALRTGRGLRLSRVSISPPPEYTSEEIVTLRLKKLRMSQAVFAQYMGVSSRVIQAWEQGWREPSNPSRRLIQLAAEMPKVFRKLAMASTR